MHICFITSEYPKIDFPHGGVGTFVKVFSKQLSEFGHKVSVIGINNYTKRDEVEYDEEVTIYRLKPRRVKGLTWLLNNKTINSKIIEIHKSNPINIIETAELGLAFMSKIKAIRYVIRLHGGHHFFAESENRKVSAWKAYQEKRSFKKADGFIAVSNFVKSHTEKYLSYNNKPLTVLSSPVNTKLFVPNKNFKQENCNVTFVGTICEKKGIRQLIMAMDILVKNYPNIKLNVYGRDWFFKKGESYIEMLKNNYSEIINKCVIFHGSVSYETVPEVYGKATVCVFPSHMETQGLVALEAMLMEKAVIFTQNGPGSELITHKETGLLCNPTSPEDIKDKIEWILEHPEQSLSIAKNAREFALENFEINGLTKRNIEFYDSI